MRSPNMFSTLLRSSAFDARHCFSREVMRADEQRIRLQQLGGGWLVVRIIQTHHGVSQEGGNLPARVFELPRGGCRFQSLGQIGFYLRVRVAVVVASCR